MIKNLYVVLLFGIMVGIVLGMPFDNGVHNAVVSAGGGSCCNPFDQDLNTTDKVHFEQINTSGNINIGSNTSAYMYDGVQALKLAKGTDDFYVNTLVGVNAGNSLANRQTAIGYNAGYLNTGASQTATGYNAGYLNTGDYQTTSGYAAGYSNSGIYQTAWGYAAGKQNSGIYQTVSGYAAGYSNTGIYQTASGFYAGRENTGDYQVALGRHAGYRNTGDYTNAVGNYALRDNSGTYSNAFGYSALRYNSGAGSNAFGYSALHSNNGDNNTAFGHMAFNSWTNDISEDVDVVLFADNDVTITGHGFGVADTIINLLPSTTGVLPTGLSAGVNQWTVVDADTLSCNTDTFTNAGTGTLTLHSNTIFTNSGAFGNNAEPDASNQIVLGDTSLTQVKTTGSIYSSGAGDNYFAGHVGINTSTPTVGYVLDVDGDIECVSVDQTSDIRVKTFIAELPAAAVKEFCENLSIWLFAWHNYSYVYEKNMVCFYIPYFNDTTEEWEYITEYYNKSTLVGLDFGSATENYDIGIPAQPLFNYINDTFGEVFAHAIVHVPDNQDLELWNVNYKSVSLIFARYSQIIANELKQLEARVDAME